VNIDQQLAVDTITKHTFGGYPILAGIELRDMDGNGVEAAVSFDVDAFANMTVFTFLELTDVRLSTIPYIISPVLTQLTVTATTVSTIDVAQLFRAAPNIEFLNLRGNPRLHTFIWPTTTYPSFQQLALAELCDFLLEIPWSLFPNFKWLKLDAQIDKDCHVTSQHLPSSLQLVALSIAANVMLEVQPEVNTHHCTSSHSVFFVYSLVLPPVEASPLFEPCTPIQPLLPSFSIPGSPVFSQHHCGARRRSFQPCAGSFYF
jgi:hypothetical protein